jgi:hypothetical protein
MRSKGWRWSRCRSDRFLGDVGGVWIGIKEKEWYRCIYTYIHIHIHIYIYSFYKNICISVYLYIHFFSVCMCIYVYLCK